MRYATPLAVLTLAWSCIVGTVAAHAATVKVEAEDMSFSPARLAIRRGDVVRFSNNRYGAHLIRSRTSGQSFSLGRQESGEERERAFTQPGEVAVSCDFHPHMTLVIRVE